jgi:hypothetical protein
MNLRYRVELSQAERDELKTLLSGGKHAVRKVKRAQILLAADAGASDEEIATSVCQRRSESKYPQQSRGLYVRSRSKRQMGSLTRPRFQ